LTVIDSSVTGNFASSGGEGGEGGRGETLGRSGGAGGPAGFGGGIYAEGPLTIGESAILGNDAGSGGVGGPGSWGSSGGLGGNGASGGGGGGVFGKAGVLTITQSTVASNAAGNGGNGGLTQEHNGGGGGGNGAAGGRGGGVLSVEGRLSVLNSTIAENFAGFGGNGGYDTAEAGVGTGGNGGSGELGGFGGGIASLAEEAQIVNATVAGNVAGLGGAAGLGGLGGSKGGKDGLAASPGIGGGIFRGETGGATLQGSIFAANGVAGNCAGTLIGDGGGNLNFAGTGCPSGFASGDPKLGPLQDNGGPTQTIALLPGSAAIDKIPATGGCPAVDQRGVTRPQPAGGLCDIGAFELVPSVASTPTPTPTPTPGTPPVIGGATPAPAALVSAMSVSPKAFQVAASGPSALAATARRSATA
jgi:hypothetical protein